MDSLTGAGELPALDSAPVDPAQASAAADPLPGAKRGRGRPKGSKDKAPRTPRQIASAQANLASARAKQAQRVGPTDKQLEEAVAGLYAMTGMGVGWFDQEIGLTIAECSERAAAAWMHLAQQNPAVRRALVQLTTATAAGELLTAHLPIMALVVARLSSRNVPTTPEGEPVATNGFGQVFTAAPGYAG